MYNKIISIARATFINYLLSIVLSNVVILASLALFSRELENENFWTAWTACFVINIFVSAFVHFLFAVGGIFWINTPFKNEHQALQSCSYILIIPSICYAAIAGLFLINNEGYIDYAFDFAAIAFITLLLIYSISLRTYLYQLLNFNNYEKSNE